MADLVHEDRRGLTKLLSLEQLRALRIEGLILLDLRFCRRDSEVIAADKNLPEVAEWLADTAEREWLEALLCPEQRELRITEMEECAAEQDWHNLTCLLSGWHDDLNTMQLAYARWDADAPRRNAKKKRRKTQERGVNWQRELAAHFRTEDARGKQTRLAKFRSLPREYEEPLTLYEGKWKVWRDSDGLVVCEDDTTGQTQSIARATFDGYLKEKPQDE